MKTQGADVWVGVAIVQVILLLAIWGLCAVCDVLIAWVYWVSRFGMCDGGIWLLDRLCERDSAEMNIEDKDVKND